MGMFPDDEEGEEIDDKFAENVLQKAINAYSYVDVDDIADAYNWFMANDRHDDALVVLDYGLSIHAGNCKLLLIRAMVLIDNSELAKAEMLLDYVADDASGDPNYHISRGWLALKKGDDKLAEKHFDEAVKVAADDMIDNTAGEIGSNLVQFEKFGMSIKYFAMLQDSYLRSIPQTAFEYAYALSFVGQDDRAMKLYEQITDGDPFYDSAWYNLGIIYSKKGLLDKAIEAYTNCTDANTEYAEAYFNLGNIYLEMDDILGAVDCYTSYLSLSQPAPEMRVYAYLGDCWLRLGNVDLAERILDYVVKNIDDCDSAWYDLGRCHLERGLNTQAAQEFRRAIDLNPCVACYHFAMAQASLNVADLPMAIHSMEDGLRCAPDDVLAWFELIRMSFDFSNCDSEKFNNFLNKKKREFGEPKALLLVEAYVEFFVFNKKRAATSLMRDVAKCMPQIIMDAAVEPNLSKLFEQKGIVRVLDEFNIKLK